MRVGWWLPVPKSRRAIETDGHCTFGAPTPHRLCSVEAQGGCPIAYPHNNAFGAIVNADAFHAVAIASPTAGDTDRVAGSFADAADRVDDAIVDDGAEGAAPSLSQEESA